MSPFSPSPLHYPQMRLSIIASLIIAASVTAAPALSVPAAPSTPVNPHIDPFYTPPAGWCVSRKTRIHTYTDFLQRIDTTPGTILKNRTVVVAVATLVPVPVHGFQVLYRTTDAFGNPMATITTIMVPTGAAPDKLVVYASAEDAVDIQCAPSFLSKPAAVGETTFS